MWLLRWRSKLLGVDSRLTGTPLSIKRQDLLLDYNDRNDRRGCIATTIKKEAVKDGANYLNGKFVTERQVTQVVIDGKAQEVEKTFKNPDTGIDETSLKVEVDAVANDDDKTRVLWTMNKTSRNLIVEVLGEDETQWIGKQIPIIVSSAQGGKPAVYPNEVEFRKLYGKKQRSLL